MDEHERKMLGYSADEKTAYEIGKEKGFPDPIFNPFEGIAARVNGRIVNEDNKLVNITFTDGKMIIKEKPIQ